MVKVGVPLEQIGSKLLKLNDAIKGERMYVAADSEYRLEFLEGHDDIVKCVNLNVYLLSEEGEEK